MLVSKTYDKDAIVSFKLSNGDEIVAKVVDETATTFQLNKPCTVVPSSQGLGLIQSLFTGQFNKDITVEKSHVLMHSETVKDVTNHYIQTTTGIQPVSNSGIIT